MKNLIVGLSFLFAGISAFGAPLQKTQMTAAVECQPAKALSAPFMAGWNQVLAIQTVSIGQVDVKTMKDSVLKVGFKFIDARDGKSKSALEEFTLLAAEKSPFVYWAERPTLAIVSATFLMNEVKAPILAGPMPPGDFPATATLALVSQYRVKPGGDQMTAVIDVPLNCTYSVRYVVIP